MTLHREHAQVKDLWMDYRAHHSHVVKVVDNELQEEMNEREIIRNDVCQYHIDPRIKSNCKLILSSLDPKKPRRPDYRTRQSS
jgi:hypothetical protein